MSSPNRKALTYRPALDGLRGVAVLGVLIYHLWPHVAAGGWLGVDLFFVLSGYLITTLLVTQFIQRGRIDLVGFWQGRLRRLMPTLIVVVVAVILAASHWTVPARRSSVAWDIFATLTYWANWRFLGSNEAYFSAVSAPSPLRHAWSLSIEEQYYLVFPILLMVLVRFIHRRRNLAIVFAIGAIASALTMALMYHPDIDPTRVYYGTDTRAFELLVGAAAGAWIGPSQWGHEGPSPWLRQVERFAPVALIGLVVSFFLISEDDAFVFRGGSLLFCLLALVPILAAASPYENAFSRTLSWEWLRRLGLISYALYLWHWPVHVYLDHTNTGISATLAPYLQAIVSIVLATLTYRYLEHPIRRGGLRSLVPGRPTFGPAVAALAAIAVIAGALELPHFRGGGTTAAQGSGGGDLTYHAKPYTPGAKQKIVLVGNSIPDSLFSNFPVTSFPDLSVTQSTSFGCVPYEGSQIVDGTASKLSSACATFHKNWSYGLMGEDTAVYFVPQNLLNKYRVGGTTYQPHTPAGDAFVRRTLDEVAQGAHDRHVKHLVYLTLACHELPDLGQGKDNLAMNDITAVKHLNLVVKQWTATNHVSLIDQYSFLCPGDNYHGTINGVDLYSDALHFTSQSGPIMWSWLAPQLQKIGRSQ